MLCPEFRHLQNGVNLPTVTFQSAQLDVHQLRLQLLLGGRPESLIQTLSILPEYLRNQATESGAVIDYPTGTSS